MPLQLPMTGNRCLQMCLGQAKEDETDNLRQWSPILGYIHTKLMLDLMWTAVTTTLSRSKLESQQGFGSKVLALSQNLLCLHKNSSVCDIYICNLFFTFFFLNYGLLVFMHPNSSNTQLLFDFTSFLQRGSSAKEDKWPFSETTKARTCARP